MRFNSNKQAGFSLVELMVVVGIIGILAALAVPRLQTFSAKAKVSEGKALVNNIVTLNNSFYAENSVYSDDRVALGYSRAAGVGFYNDPMIFVGAGATGAAASAFGTTTSTRLPLCSGIQAGNPAANVNADHNGTIRYGLAAAFPGPNGYAAAAAGGPNTSPRFTCN